MTEFCLDQPFSTHEHLAPKFGRAANFCRFYIIKIANVGLRMKVEIVETKVFHEDILFSDQPLFKQLSISLIFGRAATFLPF